MRRRVELLSEFTSLLNANFFSVLELVDPSASPSRSFAVNSDFEERLFGSSSRIAQAIDPDLSTASLPQAALPSPSLLACDLVCGLPVGTVLDLRDRERHAFEAFRMAFEQEARTLSSVPGTQEYNEQAGQIRARISKELNAVDLIWDNVRRDSRRGVARNIVTLSMSVGVALLTLSQPQLSINFIGQVVSGAGLVKGLSDLTGLWQDLRKKADDLRTKDFYFLWRVKGTGRDDPSRGRRT